MGTGFEPLVIAWHPELAPGAWHVPCGAIRDSRAEMQAPGSSHLARGAVVLSVLSTAAIWAKLSPIQRKLIAEQIRSGILEVREDPEPVLNEPGGREH